MLVHTSQRVTSIETFHVMDLLQYAKKLESKGMDIIHMEVGEPDFPTAKPIANAAKAAIEQDLTHYTPAAGIPELREAISQWYASQYGLDISPERIIITTGASSALLMVFSSIVDAGQNIIMADPSYPCNRQFLRFLDADAQLIAVDSEQNFQLSPRQIKLNWNERTAGVLLASPSNPTGTLVSPDVLNDISQQVNNLGGRLVVDEIYHGLIYNDNAHSILEFSQDAFAINSFSKYFGMTGWRLGWLVAPESSISALEKLAQNLMISPHTVSQYAALASFLPETLEILEQRRQEFHKRRDLLLNGLRELGFFIPTTPEGAFYIYAGVTHLTDNSYDFCWSLLKEDHIAVTPGLDFGNYRSNEFVRFSYTTSLERIHMALERLHKRLLNK